MIEELVFTSAERGLHVGKKGFCTVASTQGMAANLAGVLENLSGYRHLFKPNSENAHLNPVVYSHLRQRIGGQDYSILSRVTDAGSDYSNRSNKLAHHLAVKDRDRGSAGPTSILGNDDFFFQGWNEAPRQLPSRQLPDEVDSDSNCVFWKQVTGDAGWGGAVAGALLDGRTIYIVRDINTPALDLAHEAIRLLPTSQQWGTTFTTFFTKLPPKFECQLRFLIKGTPEVSLARRSESNFVVDLTETLPPCNAKYATFARNGTPIRAPDKITVSKKPMKHLEVGGANSGYATVAPDSPANNLPELVPPVRRKRHLGSSGANQFNSGDSRANVLSAWWIPLAALMLGVLAAGVPSFLFFQSAKSKSRSKVAKLDLRIQERDEELESQRQELDEFFRKVDGAEGFDQVIEVVDGLTVKNGELQNEIKNGTKKIKSTKKERKMLHEELKTKQDEIARLTLQLEVATQLTKADFIIPDFFNGISPAETSTILKTKRGDLQTFAGLLNFELEKPETEYSDGKDKWEVDKVLFEKKSDAWKLSYDKYSELGEIKIEETQIVFCPISDAQNEAATKLLKAICKNEISRIKISIDGDEVVAVPFQPTIEETLLYVVSDENSRLPDQPIFHFDAKANIRLKFQPAKEKVPNNNAR